VTGERHLVSATSISDRTTRSPESGHPTKAGVGDRAIRHRIKAVDVFLLSAWCGPASGLLEVAARVICRAIDPTRRLYMVSRHFLWLGPLSSLLFFLGIGLVSSVAVKLSPRAAGWLSPRLICGLAILPVLLAAGPGIFPEAWALFGFGMAIQLVPILERRDSTLRRKLVWTFPIMLGLVIALASYVFLGDRLKQRREAGRPLPPANSPNVLLIVLDTVRADRLSLYGYERSTTPMLERLAERGIRFDEARATAPWTLPSHASMFTGRWPHEVGENWLTPLEQSYPTLAEYLGKHGYATAGFVANVGYCSQETGLARGFTHYEDYALDKLAPLRTSGLVEYIAGTIYQMIPALDIRSLRPLQVTMHDWFHFSERKTAASVRRAYLSWLSARPETGRPFFAFLNLFDAHQEYKLPPGAQPRFIRYPVTPDQIKLVYELWPFVDKMELPPPVLDFARDSYDECLAYLDEQLGKLFYTLDNRGLLDRTLVVVTADHGEGLGEHNLFDHGESLHRTEIRAPLVIVPPAGFDRPSVVREPVSLRDLPATIVDLLGFGAGSPFPGESLARFWRDSPSRNVHVNADAYPVVSELIAPNPARPNRGRSPASRGPLVSLATGKFVYIRNERNGEEQLFDERGDPQELIDQSRVESMRPLLDDFRRRLGNFRRESPRSLK
jgi:arylsulfatase A-like enzyme